MRAMAKLERDAKSAALLNAPLFQAMRPEELAEIVRFSSERRVGKGATIFQKGDDGSSLMAVLAGRVRISCISAEGREITLNVIDAGEVFGEIALLDAKPRSADACALDDTLLMVVERRHFLPFLRRNEDLYLRLLSVLCERLRQTSLALEEMALHDLPARLARMLLKLSQDYGRPAPGGGVRIDFKMSQRDMSTLVASSRESVNKQLRSWREQGILDEEDGHIILRQPDALRALVD